MDTESFRIRALTEDEPLKEREIKLTAQQAEKLQPMNRAARRAWYRASKRNGKRK